MRCRRLIWLVPGLLFFALYLWQFGRDSIKPAVEGPIADIGPLSSGRASGIQTNLAQSFPLRVTNTRETLTSLLHSDHAVLLENAFLDTSTDIEPEIPDAFRSKGHPGAFIVQSRGAPAGIFCNEIRRRGGEVVSYIPNNAFLVRASVEAARELERSPQVQAVLPFHPFYKIKPSLLTALPPFRPATATDDNLQLNILLLPGAAAKNGINEFAATVAAAGGKVLGRSSSPFGPVFRVSCTPEDALEFATLPQVQLLEHSRTPAPAMDLSRSATGVSPDSTSESNYLGLSGTNILVAVIDSGVDRAHPALTGRVLSGDSLAGEDATGHGTHIAGVIAGDGYGSSGFFYAPGSVAPSTNGQFRGMAPAAKVLSLSLSNTNGPVPLDELLRRAASATNASVVNNSWSYADSYEYDLAAAICDAAARDALPEMAAAQPVVCVFAAGNSGGGTSAGTLGKPETVESPGTSKNGITVGALEKSRLITNETWTCAAPGNCQTNKPWLQSTDTASEVAAFSARGNVGLGLEGPFGRCKPDLVAQGTFVLSTRSSNWDKTAFYSSSSNFFAATPPDVNCPIVLSNLNESVGPLYRFESGTSVAAATVSGALALMQEFWRSAGRELSPSALKALLINGARPVSTSSSGPCLTTNLQGWGQLQLVTALPEVLTNTFPTSSSMFLFDNDSETTVSTGRSRTWLFSVSSAARDKPLRITLVWTDPPANPAAALKLVNNLDLVVTNLATGAVYLGNNIPPGSTFNEPWEPGADMTGDCVNNVESVILPAPLNGRYSVTVVGRSVNVNALSSSPGELLQDFSLVVSSGDGEIPNALAIESTSAQDHAAASAVVLTNQFDQVSTDFGAIVLRERVGDGPPVLADTTIPILENDAALLSAGSSNQWKFYVLTNSAFHTNALFATFLPVKSAASYPAGGGQPEPDIDLYVSTDPGLLLLNTNSLRQSWKSLGRGGNESIVLSNATPEPFYLGIKCESQGGADFGLAAIFSELPFSELTPERTQILRGVPAPGMIEGPGISPILSVADTPGLVRRVIVTNNLVFEVSERLRSVLQHQGDSVTLLNFSELASPPLVFEDSDESDTPASRRSDGPGSLEDLAGTQASGQWLLSIESTNKPGTNESLSIALELQRDLGSGVNFSLLPGACRNEYVQLPASITNLLASASVISGAGPITLQILPLGTDPADVATLKIEGGNQGALAADRASIPPIRSGIWTIRLCNLGLDAVEVYLQCSTTVDLRPLPVHEWSSQTPIPIVDDAVSHLSLLVTNDGLAESVDVSVRLAHERVSDLAMTLISPAGKRVRLLENRGGSSTNGLGLDVVRTNVTTVFWDGGAETLTNVVETGQSSGTVTISYEFLSLPDTMHVYYEGSLLFASGLVSGSGTSTIAYGPGTATFLTVVMNQDGNPQTNTAWFYRASVTRPTPVPLTFTENTNLASVPIKFAPTPLTNINYATVAWTQGIYYLPEQSLAYFVGDPVFGRWELEIQDTRAGPINKPAALLSWGLNLRTSPVRPELLVLGAGEPHEGLLPPRSTLWFAVDSPVWVTYASNQLVSATLPIHVLHAFAFPDGQIQGDPLLLGVTQGNAILSTNGVPPLLPGGRYYVGFQNTNAETVSFSARIDFDVTTVVSLENGVPMPAEIPGGLDSAEFYRFTVTSNAVRAQFELRGVTQNLSLMVRRGLPLPGWRSFDFTSANFWTNDELIVVYDYSAPVALGPGDWYLAVLNTSSQSAAYTIIASESETYGTNLSILETSIVGENLCLSWDSIPGGRYYVQGKAELAQAKWQTISPTVTANDRQTTYCLPLSAPYRFFRICEGLVLAEPPILIQSVSYSAAGAALRWLAEPGKRFRVEWAPGVDAVAWVPFSNVVTSLDGTFEFLDDGSQTGGHQQTRFYRLRQLED